MRGRILFLLDEVARLGTWASSSRPATPAASTASPCCCSTSRSASSSSQWGREGAQAWDDATSWRLFAAVQDPDTARELSAICGEHGVVATSRGDSTGARGAPRRYQLRAGRRAARRSAAR